MREEAISAADDAGAARDAVLVLGMHRSGTSSVAGTVAKLGATPPKSLMQLNPNNLRGYFESNALMNLNDEILASAGTVWDDWRAFNQGWYASPIAGGFYQKAAGELDREFGKSPLIVLKDPRICRMMPFWSTVFDRTGHAVRVIMPVRSPVEVGRSLWVRERMPPGKSLLLWLRHVLDAERDTRGLPRALIDWTAFIADWRAVMARAGEKIGLSWPRWSDRGSADVDRFLSPDLRHHASSRAELDSHPNVNEWIRDAYHALVAMTADPYSNSARQTLDDVRAEFDKAAKLFGRLIIDFEDSLAKTRHEIVAEQQEQYAARLAEAAARADGLEGERAALQGQMAGMADERDRLAAEREELRRRLEAIACERDRLAAEHADLRRQLEAIAGERDRLAAEAASHEGRIEAVAAERDALLRQSAAAADDRQRMQADLDERAARLDELTAERAALQGRLEAILAEKARIEAELAAHIGREAELAADRDALTAETRRLTGEHERAAAALTAHAARVSELTSERDGLGVKLQAALDDLQRHAAESAAHAARAAELAAAQDGLRRELEAGAAERKRLEAQSLWQFVARRYRRRRG